VRKSVEKKVGDVLIGQPVKDVLAVSAPRNQAFVAENAEALRDRREVLAFRGRHLCHTRFALAQQCQKTQPRTVSHGPEDARGAFNCAGLHQCRPLAGKVVLRSTGWVNRFRHGTLAQLFNCDGIPAVPYLSSPMRRVLL